MGHDTDTGGSIIERASRFRADELHTVLGERGHALIACIRDGEESP